MATHNCKALNASCRESTLIVQWMSQQASVTLESARRSLLTCCGGSRKPKLSTSSPGRPRALSCSTAPDRLVRHISGGVVSGILRSK
jgi:hypothetical protein